MTTAIFHPNNAPDALARQSFEEALLPIRPGKVHGQPFWNGSAKEFIYAPSFDFNELPGAASYRFTVTTPSNETLSFDAETPYAPLTPVWAAVPVEENHLVVTAIDKDGKSLGISGERTFIRIAPFDNRFPPRKRSYMDAAKMIFNFIINGKAAQSMKTGVPDPGYSHFCYPSKMHAALIFSLLEYAKLVPECRDEVIQIARGSADYLIRTSVPAGTPLEFLPLTYILHPENSTDIVQAAVKNVGTIMMIYPAPVARACLKLYEATQDATYLEYAVKIGRQYKRLQRPDGTWPLMLKIEDGSVLAGNACEPARDILPLLSALATITGDDSFRQCAQKGEEILHQRIQSYDWEGQFEDVNPQKASYSNLSKYPPSDAFMYLASIQPHTPEFLAQFREALHFSEDQFVVWHRNAPELEPSAMEQYSCYVYIDASVSQMIDFFLAAYDLEHRPLDLAKARALGDSLTRMQEDNGYIHTFFSPACRKWGGEWLNCTLHSARTLLKLSQYDDIIL